MKLVLTCEHALADLPPGHKILFRDHPQVLRTHEAYDPGAFDLFKELKHLADFSEYQIISRLLVEVNRSLGHPSLFSRFSRVLDKAEKTNILETYYFPYRFRVENIIKKFTNQDEEVLHLSIHSFTPILRGDVRNCDIGLLYDPARKQEKAYSQKLKEALLMEDPSLRIRFNYPYKGKADGFTTYLRKLFPENYSGIEVEVNQKWVKRNRLEPKLKKNLIRVIHDLKN